MKRIFLSSLFASFIFIASAQVKEAPERNAKTGSRASAATPVKPVANAVAVNDPAGAATPRNNAAEAFTIEKIIPSTSVKNQAQTGTCWSFSTTSLIESQALKNNLGELDLSEMFTVRNIYIEKAKNYILRQGNTRFGEGGLGHDQIRAVALYGAIPESIYSGRTDDQPVYNHSTMVIDLKAYLDTVLKSRPIRADWLEGFKGMMDKTMGTPPESFQYNNKKYTPENFGKEVLKFNPNDYVNITSFTHHPYYAPFILEVPDNFSNGQYYNVPLKEMLDIVKAAINSGYSVMWDTDISNYGFSQKKGVALYLAGSTPKASFQSDINTPEPDWNAKERQRLFENLTTEDDHLMHIVGLEKSKDGKEFFNVKNSWGAVGPYGGYIKVSEAYLAMNTVSLVVPRAALSKAMIEKLKL
jgi:bleomycin hydrolase